MTSNHYALTYGHEYNWLILVGITLAGALIRIYFVARHQGRTSPVPAVIAALIILAVAAAIAPKSRATTMANVSLDTVRTVINGRCTTCHSASPTHVAFPAAPGGVVFDTDEQIQADAARIHQQTVVLKVMPIGNLTDMTDHERDLIDAWFLSAND